MNVPVARQAPCNPRAAAQNRRLFEHRRLVCVNLLGPTGCGKTALLEAVLPRLAERLRVGVLAGDLAGTGDADRIARLEIPVVQVLTDGRCHLSADQVQHGLKALPVDDLDLLVIENAGSAACQAAMDLGEHLRVAVLSVAGGDRVVGKYPGLFREAGLVLVSKVDLLPHVEFDLPRASQELSRISPNAEVICTDTRRRVGIDRLAGWLLGYVRAQRCAGPRPAAHAVAHIE
jgi:hydrogenase nickel incorporation protein HypB